MHGNPLTLTGSPVKVGDTAPDFTAVANDMSEFKLSSLKGKCVLISAVPSLDTPVCSRETRRFNEEAAKIDGVRVVTISMDLPFAQSRWCAAEGVKNIQTVSDYRDAAFGESYGLLIKELRLLARCVMVVDTAGKITYVDLVKEVTEEPNYNAALAAAKKVVESQKVAAK
jgi:thiol peroxidase